MKQLLPTPGYKVRFAVPLQVRRAAGRTALFSVKSGTANNTRTATTRRLLARSARPLPQASAPSDFAMLRGHSGRASGLLKAKGE